MKLKTRTNQPVYYKLPVSSNIQSLSDDLLNSLRVGDVVQKKTGNQKHCYIVTYKEEKKGICLTYTDCGYMETISYDYNNGHWVFNSKDVCEVASKSDVKLENIKDAQGHQRFIEGNLTTSTIAGVTYSYAKWSLSGTHLMIVLAGVTSVTINAGTLLGEVSLPQWIANKIYTLSSSTGVVSFSDMLGRSAEPVANVKYSCYILKDQTNIRINNVDAINPDEYSIGFRVQFDLLIDNGE